MNPKDDLQVDAQIQNEQRKEDRNFRQDNMLSFLGDLKSLRTKKEQLKAAYDNAMKEFNDLNGPLLDKVSNNKADIVTAEDSLRLLAMDEFRETGSKKLPGGLGIRIMKQLVYNELKAFDWALDHKMALQLDKKEFEKLAKASEALQKDFVKIKEKVTATIPKEIK